MKEKPIVLEQIFGLSGYDLRFTTARNIANKDLFRFYSDVADVLKQLDPQINDIGDDYINSFSGFQEPISKLFKIRDLEKSLRVKNGNSVVRYHNISYKRNPAGINDEDFEFIKDNMFKDILRIKPNLKLHSSKPVYNHSDLVESIRNFGYVDTSRYNGDIFNPERIVAAARSEEHSRLTKTGKIIRLVE